MMSPEEKVARLRDEAQRVGRGDFIPQRQDSLTEQMEDLTELARRFGMYDAQDWLNKFFHNRT